MRATARGGIRVPNTNVYLMVWLCAACEAILAEAGVRLYARRPWKYKRRKCNNCDAPLFEPEPEAA